MKQLKKNCDVLSFLNAVKSCEGEVCLTAANGDVLNLKSSLCQYIFAFAISSGSSSEFLQKAIVTCGLKRDYDILSEYLTDCPDTENGLH